MEFKCPHCNVEIETEDRIDCDIDSDFIECKMIGSCPECSRTYTWKELYKYEKSYDFVLADEPDPFGINDPYTITSPLAFY